MTAGLLRQKYTLERALNQGAAMAHRPRAEYVSKFHAGEIWCTPCRRYHPRADMILRRTKTTGYDNICKEQALVRATLRHLKTGRIRTTNNPTVLRILREEQIRAGQQKEESAGPRLQAEETSVTGDSGQDGRSVYPGAAR